MPLTSLRLRNFKSFADTSEVAFAPLSLIFGRNNTGKSSLLQSLFLLRQTLDAPEYGARLNLRGPLYDAGSYADLVHQHRSKERIVMQFGLELPRTDRRTALVEFEFGPDEPQPPRLVRLSIEGPDGETIVIRRGRGAGGPYELSIGDEHLGGERKAEFRFPLNRFLPLIGPEPNADAHKSREKARAVARTTLVEFTQMLQGLRAVGAFRRQPERRYEFIGRAPDRIDAAGNYVVNALIEDATRKRRRGELTASVNRWLRQVGKVRLLPLRRISRAARLFEVRLRDTDSGRWANFADVGFGIGQAFPVIVEGLRTPPGGLFIVQEPEIHLHPDSQLAMADFLVDLVREGRRVVVETHSEHLLLRVRHQLLRDKLAPSDLSVIFVEKTMSGASHTRRVTVDELGQVRDWPGGFMEEATKERISLMADMAKRVESGAAPDGE